MGNDEVLRLGDGSAGEHPYKMTTAHGKDTDLGEEFSRGAHFGHVDDFNHLRHFRGEFIRISIVQPRYLSVVRIPQSAGKFRGLEPRLIVTSDGGEGEIVEAKGSSHNASKGTFREFTKHFPQ